MVMYSLKDKCELILFFYRERNIVEQVKSISSRFQDGLKAFSDSPIVGEVWRAPQAIKFGLWV